MVLPWPIASARVSLSPSLRRNINLRSAHQALEEIRGHVKAGYPAVYDADLKAYIDSIPRDKLLACVRMRVDRSVLQLIRMWLEIPVRRARRASRSNGVGLARGLSKAG